MNKVKLMFVVGCLLLVPLTAQAWIIQTVDNSGDAGERTDIAYDHNGYPHIVYVSNQQNIMYTHWTGQGWSGPDNIGSAELTAAYGSIVIDERNYPHISHNYKGSGYYYRRIYYLYKDETGWHSIIVWEDSGGDVLDNSIYRDPNRNVHIVFYYGGNLYYAYKSAISNTFTTTCIDQSADVGKHCRIIGDKNNNLHVCYYDLQDGDLKYAYYDGSTWSTQIVDADGDVGKWCDITVDDSDIPHISYYDATNGHLKYAKMNP